jgi:cytochrome b
MKARAVQNLGQTAGSAALTKVWDIGIRLFHWLLVAAVAIAAVTGFFGPANRLNLHIAAGAAIGALILFRVVWGLLGPTYARFSGFLFSPAAIVAHVRMLSAGRHLSYLGHNPLGGVMVLALLAVLTLILMTGVAALGGVDKQGPLAFAVVYEAGATFLAIHRALAYLLMLMICAHLAGVVFESIAGDRRLVVAMIDGKKAAIADASAASPAKARPVGAAIAIFLVLAGAIYEIVALSARPASGVPAQPLDATYLRECGSCHMAYPPSLAPKARWGALMAGLADHFGEDASLEPRVKAEILAFLTENSAEKWDTRAAHAFALSSPGDPLRLTVTSFWTWAHRRIPEGVFKSKSIGAKGACNACHSDALTGRFNPQNIDIPREAYR